MMHIYPISQSWFVWVAVGAIIAGIIRGLTGFGSAMVLFPILSLAVGPQMAAPIMQALDYALALPLVPGAVRHCRWHEVIPLSIGAILFVPLGVLLLLYVNGDDLRRAAAVAILAVVGAMALGWRYRAVSNLKTSLSVGALSGLMGGATTLTGPPVALFWLGGQANSEGVRSSIIVFFAISEFATLIAYSVAGLFTLHVVATVIALALPYGAGLALGTYAFRLASERMFRLFALVMIAIVAGVSLVK